MSRDLQAFLSAAGLMIAAVVLQSAVLGWVAIRGVRPDLALIILAFTAVRRGSMTAQLGGFASGLVEDLLSLSPVGFHALFRVCTGFLYGLAEGSIFVDPILMPVVLVTVATLLKGLISSLTAAIFSVPAAGFRVFAGPLWIEMGYNAALAPFAFALLSLLRPLRPRDKERV
jgi:rod shape-determining protein MreD